MELLELSETKRDESHGTTKHQRIRNAMAYLAKVKPKRYKLLYESKLAGLRDRHTKELFILTPSGLKREHISWGDFWL
jgi:hypothetical protein